MISEAQYYEIKGRLSILNAWVDTKRGKNGWAVYKPEERPTIILDVTNEERSLVEEYDWMTNPPTKYLIYITESAGSAPGLSFSARATTWTGLHLGNVIESGRMFRSNFGDVRVPINVFGTNGKMYFGTYYRSSGNYARIKMLERSK